MKNVVTRQISRITDHYTAFDHCRAVLPWFQFARSREPLPRLRKLVLQLEGRAGGGRSPNFIIAFFFHVPVSLRQIAIVFRRYGKPTRQTARIGYREQLAALFYLSWRLNQPAHDYYLQKMWLRPARRSWSQFVQQREHVTFVKHLQRTLPLEQFDDKLKFFHQMKAAGIPTIEVLLVAADQCWLPQFDAGWADGVLQQDLVIKPTDGTMCDGVEIWHYDRPGNFYVLAFKKVNGVELRMSDEKFDLSGLLGRVLQLSAQRTYLVQACIKNNPTLDPLSPGSVANFRIVTAQHRGHFRVIAALLRMGYTRREFIAGVYQAAIDLETGVLGFATGRHAQWGYGETHLETGERVAGRRIENWPQLKAIALRAHAQYPWMPTIGWDALDSDRGPLLMEANAFWGVDVAQLDTPFLGEVGYAEACLEAYDRERSNASKA